MFWRRKCGIDGKEAQDLYDLARFFDLAVAAPSMKAALEAWGSKNNLFQHGFAKVSEDPKVVAATMAHPGVVLRRPVGSTGAFGEHAQLPTDLPVGNAKGGVGKAFGEAA